MVNLLLTHRSHCTGESQALDIILVYLPFWSHYEGAPSGHQLDMSMMLLSRQAPNKQPTQSQG